MFLFVKVYVVFFYGHQLAVEDYTGGIENCNDFEIVHVSRFFDEHMPYAQLITQLTPLKDSHVSISPVQPYIQWSMDLPLVLMIEMDSSYCFYKSYT